MTNKSITKKKNWPAFIPIILLNIIAIFQLYLSNYNFLTNWKGGGFGMFSNISNRFAHIHLLYKGTIKCAEMHDDFDKKLFKLTKFPSSKEINKLAKTLSKNTWVYKEKVLNRRRTIGVWMIGKNETLFQHDKPAQFTDIEILVYEIIFIKDQGIIKPKFINSKKARR